MPGGRILSSVRSTALTVVVVVVVGSGLTGLLVLNSLGSSTASPTTSLKDEEVDFPVLRYAEDGVGSAKVPMTTLRNGKPMPMIGLGCASGVRREHVSSALKQGYRLLDTAQATQWGYHEDEVGDAVAEFESKHGGSGAAGVFLQTKIHPENLGYDATTKAVYDSVRRLKRRPLDSVLIHKPRCWEGACSKKPEGDWRDSWRALQDLYDRGVVGAIGICDVDVSLLGELLQHRIKPHIVQNWYDPMHQDVAVRDACRVHGIQYQSYSTLGSQWVHFRGYRDMNPVTESPTLKAIARAHNATVVQVVLQWAVLRGVSVLPASRNKTHQILNLKSVAPNGFALGLDDLAAIDALDGDLPPKQQQLSTSNLERLPLQEGLKQPDGTVRVRFENPRRDGGVIDAFWISKNNDSEGDNKEIQVGKIEAGKELKVNSFHQHRFVFRDPTRGNQLLGDYIVNAKASPLTLSENGEHLHVVHSDTEL